MKRIYAVFGLLFSVAAHAGPDLNFATRVVLVTELRHYGTGAWLTFKRPGGCLFSGTSTDENVVEITEKTCLGATTNVKIMVPLERQKVFIDADDKWPEFDWINDSNRNYLLFPADHDAAVKEAS